MRVSRTAAVLSGLLLILGLVGIGLGGGPAVAAPTYATIADDGVTFSPPVTQFNDAASPWSASIEVDVPGDWAFVSGAVIVYDAQGNAHTDWLKLTDASSRVGQLHTLVFKGSVPNQVNGSLNRGYVRVYPLIYYRDTNNALRGTSFSYAFYHQLVGDTRASLVAPDSVKSGSALKLSGAVTCFGVAGYRAVEGGWADLYYSEPGAGSWTYVGGEPISAATGEWSHTVLAVGAELDWQVRTFPNSNNCDNATATKRVALTGAETTPPPPASGPGIPGLTVGRVTAHTAALRWSAPTENASGIIGYRFGWESESGLPQPSWSKVYPVSVENPFVMTNLCAGCLYHMWVEAVTSNGSGDRARVDVTTTSTGTPPPGQVVHRPSPPRALHGRGINRAAVLAWAAPARTYGARVNLYCVHQFGRRADRCTGGARALVARGLVNGRLYAFAVRAHTVAGWSSWSGVARVRPHR